MQYTPNHVGAARSRPEQPARDSKSHQHLQLNSIKTKKLKNFGGINL
jgi:hypothetical protein